MRVKYNCLERYLGVQSVIAFLCCQALWKLRRRQPRVSYSLLAYICVIFILGTLGNAGNMKLSELAFVDNRDYPGGPNAYLLEQSSLIKINLMCYAAYIMATWMQDGFLVSSFVTVHVCCIDLNALTAISFPCGIQF